ncbi:MAG: Uma2 family endonuclease [Gemmataceae bacterium]
MTTALKLGPADHGRRLTWEEYEAADFEEGHRYEIIRGRVYVSPLPRYTHEDLKIWLYDLLRAYAAAHPEVINEVYAPGGVFVPDIQEVTAPEPDIAAYRGLPPRRQRRGIDWRQITPVLVVEIISPGDPDKDLVRNPPLYHSVPSIAEYWVIDPRPEPYQPSMLVHRRDGDGWELIDVPHRGTYTTPLLPGFALHLDPEAE